MTEPSHVERLWLAMMLAHLWCLSGGCEVEKQEQRTPVPLEERLPETHVARLKRQQGKGNLLLVA